MANEPIVEFKGAFRFLSNFWLAPISWNGIMFPSVEHAYQAAKSLDENTWRLIATCKTAGDAKRAGKKVALRKDWEEMKLAIMLGFLRCKFRLSGLREQLLATDDRELIEGNYWHDTFWGVCNGRGENHLGQLLMQVRSELREPQPPAEREKP